MIGDPTLVALVAQAGRILEGLCERLLLDAELLSLAVLDECISDLAEGLLDRLLIA
jgi:hypothetical protein